MPWTSPSTTKALEVEPLPCAGPGRAQSGMETSRIRTADADVRLLVSCNCLSQKAVRLLSELWFAYFHLVGWPCWLCRIFSYFASPSEKTCLTKGTGLQIDRLSPLLKCAENAGS